MKALFLTLVLLYSCTRYSTIDKTTFGLRVQDVHMDIHEVSDIEWKIGNFREITVSQSMTFMVKMPRVREEDLEFLQERTGANAWILRVIQIKGSQAQDLGSTYALFQPKQVIRGMSGGPAVNISMKVFYAAAYPSERFRKFKCPAFGHDKELTSLSVKGEESPIEIELGTPLPYGEKSQLIELAPSSFNGGHNLAGEYHLEIAAYNSIKKQILGPFKRIPRYIEVQEKAIDVGSCKGVRPDLE